MESKDILKSLSVLEQNLRNVESARKQVETTVLAYEGTRKQVSQLVTEFTTVSTELSSVVKIIGNNQKMLSEDTSTKLDKFVNDMDANICILKESVGNIQEAFNITCNNIVKMHSEEIQSSTALFNKSIAESQLKMGKQASDVIDSVNAVIKAFKEPINDATNKHKEVLAGTALDFQTKVDGSLSKLNSLSQKLSDILNQLINNIESLGTKIDNAGEAVLRKFNKLEKEISAISTKLFDNHQDLKSVLVQVKKEHRNEAEKLTKLLNLTNKEVSQSSNKVNEEIEKLSDELSFIKKSNVSLRRLVVVSIISTMISIILHFIC